MAERSNAVASKAIIPLTRDRGFKSLSLHNRPSSAHPEFVEGLLVRQFLKIH